MGSSTMWVDALWDTVQQGVDISVGPYRVSRKFSIGMTIKSSERVQSVDMHGALRKALGRVCEDEVNVMLDEAAVREDLIRVIQISKKLEADLPAIEAEAVRRNAEEAIVAKNLEAPPDGQG